MTFPSVHVQCTVCWGKYITCETFELMIGLSSLCLLAEGDGNSAEDSAAVAGRQSEDQRDVGGHGEQTGTVNMYTVCLHVHVHAYMYTYMYLDV